MSRRPTPMKLVLVVAVVLCAAAGFAYYRMRAPVPASTTEAGSASSTATATAAATTAPATSPTPSAPATPPPGATTAANTANTEDFAPLFAQRLAGFATQHKLMAVAKGNIVSFDMDAIAIDTRLEHDDPTEDGKRGIGIAVGATFTDGDGTFRFTFGAVGVGRTKAEAIDQAVGGWLGLAGNALLEAVPRRTSSTAGIPMGALVAFPGSLAVRGDVNLSWSAKRDRELLDTVAASLAGLSPESSHSIAISVLVLGGGGIDGQCLIDDRAAEEMCKQVLKFPWIGSGDGYFARQLFLLRPRLTAR